MLVTEGEVLFEGFVEDALEIGRNFGVQADRRYGSAIQDGVEDFGAAVAGKGGAAGGHFVKDDAEAEEVGARIEFAAAGLFWRHVGDGAENDAWAGEVLVFQRGGIFGSGYRRARGCARSGFG